MLYLHEVPENGGDTLFANMYAAYKALSEPTQSFLLELNALHSGRKNYGDYFGRAASDMRTGRFPDAEHSVVRTHLETGRGALYVNELFTDYIVGLAPQESDAMLAYLYKHIASPRFQCRFRWQKNSVAMWDNRCAPHMVLWAIIRTPDRATARQSPGTDRFCNDRQ